VTDLRRVRQRLKSFLLRHGHAYAGSRWGPKHELFLSKIKFEDSAQHIVFTEYRMAVRFVRLRTRRTPHAVAACPRRNLALAADGQRPDDPAQH
jgi:hypothetical protein